MAIEKGLYAMPEGIEDMGEGEAMIAIDGMSDEGIEVVLEDGSVEITIVPDAMDTDIANAPFDANLAEYMDDGQLTELSADLVGEVDGDIGSRRDWAETYASGS